MKFLLFIIFLIFIFLNLYKTKILFYQSDNNGQSQVIGWSKWWRFRSK